MNNIIGIGNAICDILVKVEDDFFEQISYEKSSMSLISYEEANKLLDLIAANNYNYKISSGGSVANTIALLSTLNVKTSLIGNVSDDFYGNKFIKDIEKSGVNFLNYHNEQDKNSAKCIVLVSNDGERTLCTYLGCSSFMNLDNNKSLEIFQNQNFAYFEGYLFDNANTSKEILNLINNKLNSKLILSLSDKGCIERNREAIENFIKKTHTLIGNESEFCELLGINEINKNNVSAANKIFENNNFIENIVITLNKKGAFFINKHTIEYITVEQIKNPIDSTGAGDAFAAGYIFGLVNNFDSVKSCKIGNLLAGKVIQHLGARPNIEEPEINIEIKKIA
ncbi:MAG: adenosine kinase [Rickettsiales bacterium]|nr:adenosine kinase [Rickettsiales bacterium]